MVRTSIALALAVPALVAAAPAPQQNTLDQVQRHLRGVTSMVADFSQTDRNGRTVNGTMLVLQQLTVLIIIMFVILLGVQ